jgi:hypothetical protein
MDAWLWYVVVDFGLGGGGGGDGCVIGCDQEELWLSLYHLIWHVLTLSFSSFPFFSFSLDCHCRHAGAGEPDGPRCD